MTFLCGLLSLKLNQVTIDKFSIPMIEELLNKLHGNAIFLKLDLHLGYHHSRIWEEDMEKIVFRTRGVIMNSWLCHSN